MRYGHTMLWIGLVAAGAAATGLLSDLPRRTNRVISVRFGVMDPPIVGQFDITVTAPTSNHRRDNAPLECSGLIWLNGQLVIASDRHEHVLFTAPMDVDAMTVDQPKPIVLIRNESELLNDIESLTHRVTDTGKGYVYALTSLSNDETGLPVPTRRQMMRVAVTDDGQLDETDVKVLAVDHLRRRLTELFMRYGVTAYRAFQLDAQASANTYRWGNVEGMAFSPDGKHLLCGMRNPVSGDRAIVFVITDVDKAFDTGESHALRITDVLTLDLGGRGISDLAWDPVTRGYLITALKSNGPKLDDDEPYPPDDLDGAIYWWSGRRTERPVQFAEVPNMMPEAISRVGESPFIVIGTDEGDVSELRPQRQSRLIFMVFTGLDLDR